MKQLVEDRGETYVPAFTLTPEKKELDPNAQRRRRPVGPTSSTTSPPARSSCRRSRRVVQQLMAALRDPDVDTRKIGEALSQGPGAEREGAAPRELVVLRRPALDVVDRRRRRADRHPGAQPADRRLRRRRRRSRTSPASTCRSSGATRCSPRPPPTSSRRACRPTPEEAYICGLLHATGHLILCQTYPEIADLDVHRLRDRPRRRAGRDRARAPSASTTRRSARCGSRRLGFPQSVADTIRNAAPRAEPSPTKPLVLALRGGVLAGASAAAARTTPRPRSPALPARRASRSFGGADGKPDARLRQALRSAAGNRSDVLVARPKRIALAKSPGGIPFPASPFPASPFPASPFRRRFRHPSGGPNLRSDPATTI